MIEDGPCLALTKREASETGGNMSLDGQVLVIAIVAIALNLLIWAREADVAEVEDELHRKDAFQRDGGGQLRLRAREVPELPAPHRYSPHSPNGRNGGMVVIGPQ
jgi:hypothetical protein